MSSDPQKQQQQYEQRAWLQHEAGVALLEAIVQAAPSARSGGPDEIGQLAAAYRLTVEGMLAKPMPGAELI